MPVWAPAREPLNRVRSASTVSTTGGDKQISEGAEIVRVHIIAGPHLGVPFGLNLSALMLEDLECILHPSHESPASLWYFIHDLTQPPNVREMFAWDLIDRWEVWRQKSFYRGGVPLIGMSFAPHAAAVERENAVPAEPAHHALGLAPLRDWPAVMLNHRQCTEIGDIRADTRYQILPQPIPVAVAKTYPSAPHEPGTVVMAVGVPCASEEVACRWPFAASAIRSQCAAAAGTSRCLGPPRVNTA